MRVAALAGSSMPSIACIPSKVGVIRIHRASYLRCSAACALSSAPSRARSSRENRASSVGSQNSAAVTISFSKTSRISGETLRTPIAMIRAWSIVMSPADRAAPIAGQLGRAFATVMCREASSCPRCRSSTSQLRVCRPYSATVASRTSITCNRAAITPLSWFIIRTIDSVEINNAVSGSACGSCAISPRTPSAISSTGSVIPITIETGSDSIRPENR